MWVSTPAGKETSVLVQMWLQVICGLKSRGKTLFFRCVRFHVKQPPPASGLRVLYKPGPVSSQPGVNVNI